MQVARIHIENFRGVKDATFDFVKHCKSPCYSKPGGVARKFRYV